MSRKKYGFVSKTVLRSPVVFIQKAVEFSIQRITGQHVQIRIVQTVEDIDVRFGIHLTQKTYQFFGLPPGAMSGTGFTLVLLGKAAGTL